MLSPKLKADIRKLWDRFWAGGIANPLTAIEQITYLVFLRQLEELDDKRKQTKPNSSAEEISVFDVPNGHLYRWSYIKLLYGEECLEHIRGPVFNWMRQLEGAEDRMRDAVFVIPNANLLRNAIDIIDDLFVTSRNQDTLGDIYEYLLSEIAEAGKNGQFRTPRHIIRAMCELVDPQPGESICDPACGTGGFLINAYQHILKSNTSDMLEFEADGTPVNARGDELDSDIHDILRSNHFHGYDFDRTMVRLGWMNMILHGMKNPQINYANTLGSYFNHTLEHEASGKFDVVLANPPFTGSLDRTDIGQSLRWPGTTNTALLFIDLILQLLRPGGRAAVIVPEGVLFTGTHAYREIRQKLLRETQLNGVISLPDGVFNPYTNVKSSILVFTKGGHTENIWFYNVEADGYSLNAKRTDQPMRNDLWDMTMKYRLRHAASFKRPAPAFVDGDMWRYYAAFDEKSLSLTYFQPLFVRDQRNYENGDSIYPGTQEAAAEWNKSLEYAHDRVVNEVTRRLEIAAEEKLQGYLQREIGRMVTDGEQSPLWSEQQEESRVIMVESAVKEVRKTLEQQSSVIRRSFEKAAEGILKTDTYEKYGLEAMLFAVTIGLTAREDILAKVPEKVHYALEHGVAIRTIQEPRVAFFDVQRPEERYAAELGESIRPFAKLDGYSRLMFGQLRSVTEELRREIAQSNWESDVALLQFPDLPKDWVTTLPEILENDTNFRAGRYKPLILKTLNLDPPEKIMAEWQELHQRIQDNYVLLQSMMKGDV